MSSAEQLLLYGIFRELVQNRVPLGVSDYLDAVRALEWHVEQSGPGFGTREGLRRLCHVLWARSQEETRLIDRIIDSIAPPTSDDLDRLGPILDRVAPSTDRRHADRLPVESGRAGGAGRRVSDPVPSALGSAASRIAVAFEPLGGSGTIALPYPTMPLASETFVMQPQTVVSARALAVLWRRYRRTVRSGPRTELDVQGTTEALVRNGIVDRPMFRARRASHADLLILADASPSMRVWLPFLDELTSSIALSRIRDIRLLFFSNVPRRALFTSPSLSDPVPAKEVLEAHARGGLLVISDGGAARGFFNRARVEATADFLHAVDRKARFTVWMNPMPASRWHGTTIARVAEITPTKFLTLDYSSLLRAVDILRGAKAN